MKTFDMWLAIQGFATALTIISAIGGIASFIGFICSYCEDRGSWEKAQPAAIILGLSVMVFCIAVFIACGVPSK